MRQEQVMSSIGHCRHQMQHHSTHIIVSGDFNHVSLCPVLKKNIRGPLLHQQERGIWLFFHPQLRHHNLTTDRNQIHLVATHKELFKQQVMVTRMVKVWSQDAAETLL